MGGWARREKKSQTLAASSWVNPRDWRPSFEEVEEFARKGKKKHLPGRVPSAALVRALRTASIRPRSLESLSIFILYLSPLHLLEQIFLVLNSGTCL